MSEVTAELQACKTADPSEHGVVATAIWCCFISFWLTLGSPDLLDALITYFMTH